MRAAAEAQARAQQQKKPAPAAPRPAGPPQREEPRRLVPARSELPKVVEAEVIDAELAETGDSVSRHVSQHLRGAEEIAAHTRQLGAEVDSADEKLEAHLHQVFDHELGRLKNMASQTAATPPPPPAPDVTAHELLTLLRSPESIRDAIVMAEVLRRPLERW
jgi:hypothetical protein